MFERYAYWTYGTDPENPEQKTQFLRQVTQAYDEALQKHLVRIMGPAKEDGSINCIINIGEEELLDETFRAMHQRGLHAQPAAAAPAQHPLTARETQALVKIFNQKIQAFHHRLQSKSLIPVLNTQFHPLRVIVEFRVDQAKRK